MLRFATTALAFSLLTACATEDRLRSSEFEPFDNGEFRFRADQLYPYTDEDLIGWLEASLHENNYCPNGYQITETKEVVRAKTIFGDANAKIFYGKCT